jgi:hypothetical protein
LQLGRISGRGLLLLPALLQVEQLAQHVLKALVLEPGLL